MPPFLTFGGIVVATDFDYLATRNEIIEGAFQIVGAHEAGQTLSAELLDVGIKALQRLVKRWANKGFLLWNFESSSFSSVASQELYDSTLDQAIIGIDKAWVVDSNDDIPIEVISYSRYLDIYDKETNTGRPLAIAFRKTPSPSVYLWPSPDAIYTVKILAAFKLMDFDSASGSGDIPAEYQSALEYGLAEDLFDKFPGPMNERVFIATKAATLFGEAKNFDQSNETTSEVESLYGRRGY